MDASATKVADYSPFTIILVKSLLLWSLLRPQITDHSAQIPFSAVVSRKSYVYVQKLGCGCGSALSPGWSDARPQPAGKMDDGPEEDILPPRSLRGGEVVITDWPLRWQAVTLRLHSGELGGAQIMGCAEVAWTFYCFVLISIYIYLCLYVLCVCVSRLDSTYLLIWRR